VVGRATAVLGRRDARVRVLELATLVTALAVLGAIAEDLPGFSEATAVAIGSFLVLPAFMATIWLALPLGRVKPVWLLTAAAAAGLLWIGCYFAGFGVAANFAKLACFVLVGFWFLSLFEFLWWITLVALLVPWVDIWSVAFGPTNYVTEEQPGFFESVSVALNVPGESGTANIGPPDFVFFTLFLAATQRFHLRTTATWICMTGFLSATLLLVWALDSSGLPALPAVCLGFVLPNADLLWKDARDAYRSYRAERREKSKAL
jgi:hypothetical protein